MWIMCPSICGPKITISGNMLQTVMWLRGIWYSVVGHTPATGAQIGDGAIMARACRNTSTNDWVKVEISCARGLRCEFSKPEICGLIDLWTTKILRKGMVLGEGSWYGIDSDIQYLVADRGPRFSGDFDLEHCQKPIEGHLGLTCLIVQRHFEFVPNMLRIRYAVCSPNHCLGHISTSIVIFKQR